jgi:hypothetical protein
MFRAAAEYIKMGFALIPVWGLADFDGDRCLCGSYPCGMDNKNSGKHPVRGKWTQGAPMDIQEAYHTWEEDNPDYNMGARTGEASGFFALDVEAEGLQELGRLEGIHGALPRTRTHGTGGGGKHFLYRMPGFDVRNNQKKLSDHIDIRGTGGMIVLPPSASGKGKYVLLDDAPIADAPEWLLDWLRSRLKAEGLDLGEMTVIEDLPLYSDLNAEHQQACQRYALSVIQAEAANYASAPPGTGNGALYEAACNILEIVQSPWNLYTYDDAAGYLENARRERLVRRPGGGQDEEEFKKTFMSARSKTLGKGRPVPADRSEGLRMDVPFSPPGGGDYDPFTTPGSLGAPKATEPAVDPVAAMMAELLDRDGLDSIPPPPPLIFGVLDKDSETWLVAPSGGFKSFVALDMAIHVGMGLPWRGNRTVQGLVVYIVAEGGKGIRLRVDAWEKVNGKRSSGVKYLTRPVQVKDERNEWAVLVEMCRQLQPSLIVIDTQARVTLGMEENSSTEMGIFVAAVGSLKAATGACVMVVHHTGKAGVVGRGSSALYAAADTELRIERPMKVEERKALTATIHASKQKDMEEESGIEIQMEKVDLGIDPVTGRPLSSLAPKPWEPFRTPVERPEPEHRAKLTDNKAMLLEALREHADHEAGATAADLRMFIKERYGMQMARGSAGTALTQLVKDKLIVRLGTARYILAEYALEF